MLSEPLPQHFRVSTLEVDDTLRVKGRMRTPAPSYKNAAFYDDFQRSNRNLMGDASPTGQVWEVGNGTPISTHVKIVGNAMVRDNETTYYPQINVGEDVRVMGARVKWTASGTPGATDTTALVFLILSGNGINTGPFYHVSFNRDFFGIASSPGGVPAMVGHYGPDIYGNGPLSLETGVEHVFQLEISEDGETLTIRHPRGATTVTVPGIGYRGGPFAQYEFITTYFAGAYRDTLAFLEVWCNPSDPHIPGATVPTWTHDGMQLARRELPPMLSATANETVVDFGSTAGNPKFDMGLKINAQIRLRASTGYAQGGIRFYDGSDVAQGFIGMFEGGDPSLYFRHPIAGGGLKFLNGAGNAITAWLKDNGGFNLAALPIADPHVAGDLFRTGNAVMISTG